MNSIAAVILLALATQLAVAQSWVEQTSGSRASLRGLSAPSAQVVWASGTGGTYLVTDDGGTNWKSAAVPGAEALDFRDVHAFDRRTAYLMSSGTGDKSCIYKTTDGGANWTLQFKSPDAKGFFDSFAFWDPQHGILVGDPTDGRMTVFTTEDGGAHWVRQSPPPALENEGAFAASGTSIVVAGNHEAWFATGGASTARVYHTADSGRTWTVTIAPLRNDGPSAGIFSLGFSDTRHGIAVGGDYNKPEATDKNIAVTSDGGRTWTAPAGQPAGFRSGVVYVADRKMWVAVGTSGSDISTDGGASWKKFDSGPYNAVAFSGSAGWAVGPRGRVARFQAQ